MNTWYRAFAVTAGILVTSGTANAAVYKLDIPAFTGRFAYGGPEVRTSYDFGFQFQNIESITLSLGGARIVLWEDHPTFVVTGAIPSGIPGYLILPERTRNVSGDHVEVVDSDDHTLSDPQGLTNPLYDPTAPDPAFVEKLKEGKGTLGFRPIWTDPTWLSLVSVPSEIRLVETYLMVVGQAVPEPGSLALIGLAAPLLLRRRRALSK